MGGWYFVSRCFTPLSLSLSLGMGSVLAWCVCVLYRIDCAMSCHVMSCHVDGHLPTYLLATLTLTLQWTKTDLLLALAWVFNCNFIQLRCVPFSTQCSPSIHPSIHANNIISPFYTYNWWLHPSIHPSCSAVMQISFSSFLSLSLPSIPLNGWDGMGWVFSNRPNRSRPRAARPCIASRPDRPPSCHRSRDPRSLQEK